MSQQMGLSYRTVYRAVSAIRLSILSHAKDAEGVLGGEIEIDESYFGGRCKGKRGRGAAGKVPVFGILERNGIVQVTVVPESASPAAISSSISFPARRLTMHAELWGGLKFSVLPGWYVYMRMPLPPSRRGRDTGRGAFSSFVVPDPGMGVIR